MKASIQLVLIIFFVGGVCAAEQPHSESSDEILKATVNRLERDLEYMESNRKELLGQMNSLHSNQMESAREYLNSMDTNIDAKKRELTRYREEIESGRQISQTNKPAIAREVSPDFELSKSVAERIENSVFKNIKERISGETDSRPTLVKEMEERLKKAEPKALEMRGRIEETLSKEIDPIATLASRLTVSSKVDAEAKDMVSVLLLRHADKDWFKKLEKQVLDTLQSNLNKKLSSLFGKSNICLDPSKISDEQAKIIEEASNQVSQEFFVAIMVANFGLKGLLADPSVTVLNSKKNIPLDFGKMKDPVGTLSEKYVGKHFREHFKKCANRIDRTDQNRFILEGLDDRIKRYKEATEIISSPQNGALTPSRNGGGNSRRGYNPSIPPFHRGQYR